MSENEKTEEVKAEANETAHTDQDGKGEAKEASTDDSEATQAE